MTDENSEKKWLELETRAAASELLLAHLFKMSYDALDADEKWDALDADEKWIADSHAKMRKLADNYVHPGSDPAMSDHLSAEIAYWIDQILKNVEDIRRRYAQAEGRKRG